MNDKMEQRVCINFCLKLGRSANETLEVLREAFGEHSLGRTAVFEWNSSFKASRVSVKNDESSGQSSTNKMTENVEEFENSSTKTFAEQSMSSQTPFGSVIEFASRS
jgi:hypothetical protein